MKYEKRDLSAYEWYLLRKNYDAPRAKAEEEIHMISSKVNRSGKYYSYLVKEIYKKHNVKVWNTKNQLIGRDEQQSLSASCYSATS